MARETTPLNGHVHVRAWEKQSDGSEKLVKDDTIKNLVVTVGKNSILKYIGNVAGVGFANQIGVGDSTTAAAVGQTDLQASSNKVYKNIVKSDRLFITPTLFLSVDFGYSEANFTWNELALRDIQEGNESVITKVGSTVVAAIPTPILWARQVDSSPLVKTSSKRAIVEWQLSM